MISEVDIKDHIELFHLQKGEYFTLDLSEPVAVPPASDVFDPKGLFKFMGVDGMYSKCYDSLGNLHHFAAWTKVVPWVIDEK